MVSESKIVFGLLGFLTLAMIENKHLQSLIERENKTRHLIEQQTSKLVDLVGEIKIDNPKTNDPSKKPDKILNNTELMMEISSAERVRFLAVQIGLQRGAGIYGETSCINRQAFSIEEIKNVMFLLSKGYREVNFEFHKYRDISAFGWKIIFARSQLKIKNTGGGKRVKATCIDRSRTYEYIKRERIETGCEQSWSYCREEEEDGYQVFSSYQGYYWSFNVYVID